MRAFAYPVLKMVAVELYSLTGLHSQTSGGDGLSPTLFTIPAQYRPSFSVSNAIRPVLNTAGVGSICVSSAGAVQYALSFVKVVTNAGGDTGVLFYSYE